MEKNLKKWLSLLLLFSIFLSLILVILGGLGFLAQHSQEDVSYQHFLPGADNLTSLRAIWEALITGQPLGLVQLGFLILVFAQIIRVLVLACFFWRSSEFILAISSFFIFLVITYSMLWRE